MNTRGGPGIATGTINVAELIDNSRIGALQISTFALCLLCLIMDGFDERLMHTTAVAPSEAARRYACSKAPGDGAAVSGRTGDAATRRQNSLGLRSRRSTNSSFPKRMVSGTTSMLRAFVSASARSQALSVTILTFDSGGS